MSATVVWGFENFSYVEKQVQLGLQEGMLLAGEHLLNKSRAIVPHEDGDLMRSGAVSTDFRSVDNLILAVSYDTPYAVVQHERLDYRHDAGRSAKYLEKPAHAERGAMGALVGGAVRRRIR